MRRILLVLAVAAVMAAMTVAAAAPAFAKVDQDDRAELFRCILGAEPGFSRGEAAKNCTPPGQP